MRLLLLAISTITVLTSLQAHSAESDYVKRHCNGETEYILPDLTRVDCLTDTHAIEYDYGKKWAEAIGQSTWYAANTGRRAGIVIIIRNNSDRKGFVRLNRTIQHYGMPIDVWQIIE